jgi:hypothetical protein
MLLVSPLHPVKACAVLFLLCCTLHAADTTNVGGSVTPSKDGGIALAQTNGFGVQFFLVEGEKFFADWEKPEPPHIAPVSIAKRGVPICTAVIFVGAGLRPDGTAEVTYDTVVRKPDDSVYARDKDLVGAQEKIVPSPKALQLARDFTGIRIEPKDPAGVYTVEVVVRDKVKKVELRLKRSFTVEK